MPGSKHPPIAIGFVVLERESVTTEREWADAVQAWVPGAGPIDGFSAGDRVISFSLDGHDVIVGLMGAPIPWSDLEGPAATSWRWRTATAELQKSQAHAIVTLTGGGGTLIERSLLLTRLLAAATQAFGAIGVFWGPGTVVLSSAMLQEEVQEATLERLPILAWNEFRIERLPDGTANILTTGLEHFSCMEIEMIGFTLPLGDMIDLFLGISRLLLSGEVFRDGDTVGPDAETKLETRHAKSAWGREPPVLRIEG